MRIALGASRLRLLRQMLTENLLLAVAGGALGLGLARWSLNAVVTLLPIEITRLKPPTINGWVLVFTLLASVITGLLFGLVPARHAVGRASLGDVHRRLKDGGRGSDGGVQRRSLLNVLVASEVALSLALLIGAGLMIRTLLSLHGVDPGFHASNVLHAQVVLSPSQYTPARQVDFFTRVIEGTRSAPGVTAISAVMCLPLSGSCWSNPADGDGRSAPVSQKESEVNFNAVAPDYFRALGVPLLQGRDFEHRDTRDSPLVAIVSQTFVRRYLAGEDAIGKRIRGAIPERSNTVGNHCRRGRRRKARQSGFAGVRRGLFSIHAKPDQFHVSGGSRCNEPVGRGLRNSNGGALSGWCRADSNDRHNGRIAGSWIGHASAAGSTPGIVRRFGPYSCHGRHLQRDIVFCLSTDKRDWYSNGIRRRAE